MLEGEITDITNDARGVVKANGKVIFVKNALPGDVVMVKITKEKKKYCEGEVWKFLQYSDKRIFPNCENPLGSAYPLYALKYDFGFELKKNIVKNNFKKFLKREINIKEYSNEDFRVNKLRMHKKENKLGLYKNNTNEIYVPDMNVLLGENGDELYFDATKNIKGGTFVTIRRADNGDFLATDGEYIGEKFAGVTDKNKKTKILPVMNVAGKNYEMEIDGFFQNNRFGTNIALEIIGKNHKGKVLDLYSGVGLISLYACDGAREVTGVEIWKPSVINAKNNAKLNGITNVTFIAQDTSDFAKKKLTKYDTIIADPPRSGLVPDLIDRIKEAQPKEIVYMSCDHTTQIRDLKLLLDDYELLDNTVHVIDMFPGTTHVETVVLMSKVGVEYA